jgi:hypothetical protein
MLGSEYDTSGYKSTYRRHKALAIAQLNSQLKHNRAKFLDNVWKLLWDNVTKVGERMAARQPDGSSEPATEGQQHWWDLPEGQ